MAEQVRHDDVAVRHSGRLSSLDGDDSESKKSPDNVWTFENALAKIISFSSWRRGPSWLRAASV